MFFFYFGRANNARTDFENYFIRGSARYFYVVEKKINKNKNTL